MLRQLVSACCLCLITFYASVTSQSLPVEQAACQTVYSRKVHCLQSLDSASSALVTCPRNDVDLIVNQIQLFKLSSAAAACPTADTAPNTDSCLLYTQQSTPKLCLAHPTCYVDILSGQNGQTANCFGYNGLRYALITYTCQPRASVYGNTSSVAMALTDNVTLALTVATVTSYNPTLGPPPVSLATDDVRQLPFCSIYLPSSAGQAYIRFYNLASRPSCMEITDGTSNVSLCGSRELDQQAITLPCSDKDRFIRVRPTASVQSLYTLTVQVNYKSTLTIQCGNPPYPLYNETRTSVPTSLSPPSTTTTSEQTRTSVPTSLPPPSTTTTSEQVDDVPLPTTTVSSPMATCIVYAWDQRGIIIAAVVGGVVAVLSFIIGVIVESYCRFSCCRREKRNVISSGGNSSDDVKLSPAAENDYVDITSISRNDQQSTGVGGDIGVYSSIRKAPLPGDEIVVRGGSFTAC